MTTFTGSLSACVLDRSPTLYRVPGRIVPEQRRQGLAEVARGETAQVEHGQHLGHHAEEAD